MLLTTLILCFAVVGRKCETEEGVIGAFENGNFFLSENENLTEGAPPPPRQAALTFLRPTVVRSPSGTSFPPSRNEDQIQPRRTPATARDQGFLSFLPGIRNVFSPRKEIQRRHFSGGRILDPQNRRERPFLLQENSRAPPIPLIRSGHSSGPGLKTKENPMERSPFSPIDRVDSVEEKPSPFDYLDNAGDASIKFPTLHPRKYSNTLSDRGSSSASEGPLQGSLDAALKDLWSYRMKTYESLLARSLAIERNFMKNSYYGGRWSPVWDSSTMDMNKGFPSDLTQPNNPILLEDYVDGGHGMSYHFPMSGSYQTFKEEKPIEIEDTVSSSTFSSNPSGRSGPFMPPRSLPAPSRNFAGAGNLFGHMKNLFQGNQRKREEYPEGVIFKDRPLSHIGTRRPRMQLVKRSNRIYDVDSPGNTTDDTPVMTVALVDGEGHSSSDGIYAYYVDDEERNVIDKDKNAFEADDRMDAGNDFYYLEDMEDEGGDKVIDAELFGSDGEYVEMEYVDDEYYDEEEGGGFLDPMEGVSRIGIINDSMKLNRQGFFKLGLFGGAKRRNRRKRIRKPSYSRPFQPTGPPPESVSAPYSNFSSSTELPPTLAGGKNIRLRIKSKKNPGRKRIRMKIQEISDPIPDALRFDRPTLEGPPYREKENDRYSSSSYTHYEESSKQPDLGSLSESGGHEETEVPVGYRKPIRNFGYGNRPSKDRGDEGAQGLGYGGAKISNYWGTSNSSNQRRKNTSYGAGKNSGYGKMKASGYGGMKASAYGGVKASEYGGMKTSGYGGMKTSGYGGMKTSGYGGMKASGYGGMQNMDYGGTTNYMKGGQKGIKGSVGWANLKDISNSLPDLNKAITVMSFIAFSVFVANLGVNAIANTSLGLSFGRSGSEWSDWFRDKPDFNLDRMIHDLDQLFESVDNQNNTRTSTFDSLVNFVQIVYDDLYEITRNQMENAKQKVTNFLRNDFSEDNLPVGDISKGFLSRRLDTENPYGELEDTCYKKLLCLSHNFTRKYKSEDIRSKVLPFWTFGIGWIKGGESRMTTLLENLRAELAGQSGRDCKKLFGDCSNNTLVETLLNEVKGELLRSPLHASKNEEVSKWKPVSLSFPKGELISRNSAPLFDRASTHDKRSKEDGAGISDQLKAALPNISTTTNWPV